MRFGHDPLHFAFQKDLTWAFRDRFDGIERVNYLPVFAAELRRLAPTLPLALRETTTGTEPVVLIADYWLARPILDNDGRWLARALPQALAIHPFKVIDDADTDRRIPVVAQDDACVGAAFEHSFYDPSGELSAAVRRVMRWLRLLESERDRLKRCADWLKSHELLTALPEPAAGHVSKRRRASEGLWTLAPEKLYELAPDQFAHVGNDLPILTRLMAALLVSQTALPLPLRKKLMPMRPGLQHDIRARITFSQQGDDNGIGQPTDKSQKESRPDDFFLVDDSAIIHFDFTASGSVFNRG